MSLAVPGLLWERLVSQSLKRGSFSICAHFDSSDSDLDLRLPRLERLALTKAESLVSALQEATYIVCGYASKISIYWGYQVRAQKTSLGTMLEKESYDLRIGTSRYGHQLKDVWSKVIDLVHDEGSVLIAFGSPKAGLSDILQREGKKPEDVFDVYLNMVPNQETLTVRTEEAVAFSLSTINVMRSM